MHWLDDVRPSDSTMLLETFANTPASTAKNRRDPLRQGAIYAISATDDPAAIDFLIGLARKDPDANVRRESVSALARSKDPRAAAFLEDVLKH